ncbi:LOG family protein [Tumidithrix helvetica PCC 7403]|uniref:LOG family protein n=1 Tax=Tumidithrix helvetica TaxID=3457545 RepID=UPI003C8AFCE2
MNQPPHSHHPHNPNESQDAVNIREDIAFDIVQESVLGLWKVVNNLTRIRPSKRDRYRVSIFGSARMQRQDPLYEGVLHLASELTVMGCDIVTGGGPGLMQAANEGSVIADPEDLTRSIGIRVDLGFEQDTNPFVEQIYNHQTFFSRLHHFVLISDAFVVVPGGIGTTLEALMIWQLVQARKLHDTPLIFVGQMWADLVEWADKHMTEHKMADPADISIPQCVERFEDAVAILRAAQAQWQQKNHSP